MKKGSTQIRKKEIENTVDNFVKNNLYLLQNSLGFEMKQIGSPCSTMYIGNAYMFMEKFLQKLTAGGIKIRKEKREYFLQLLRKENVIGKITYKTKNCIFILPESVSKILMTEVDMSRQN